MRVCGQCGETIEHRHANAKFCGEQCKERARHQRDGDARREWQRKRRQTHPKQPNGPVTQCQRCGVATPSWKGRPGKFCSRACYNDSRKEATAARTEKPCSRCREVKSLAHFPNGPGTDGLRAHCRACGSEAYRWWHIEVTYGITRDQYEAMWAAQCEVCAICGAKESFAGKKFSVDHDHETGQVRGILCGSCNLGIGQLGDDPDRLIAAAFYLAQSKLVDSIG